MRVSHENIILTGPNGEMEGVYNRKTKKLINDCINKGTRNTYHPSNSPISHFLFDTIHWIKWGVCVDSPTSSGERFVAFIKDLFLGLKVGLDLGEGHT